MKPVCDVCGAGRYARPLSADERQSWPSIAGWIRFVCPVCIAFFRRSHERKRERATA